MQTTVYGSGCKAPYTMLRKLECRERALGSDGNEEYKLVAMINDNEWAGG